MVIEQESFRKYNLDKQVDSFTVRLNEEERAELEKMKKIIQQEKDSTAIKQLAKVGTKVILDPQTMQILDTITGNKRRNKRLGIAQFDED